jgi:hypothetical protein
MTPLPGATPMTHRGRPAKAAREPKVSPVQRVLSADATEFFVCAIPDDEPDSTSSGIAQAPSLLTSAPLVVEGGYSPKDNVELARDIAGGKKAICERF